MKRRGRKRADVEHADDYPVRHQRSAHQGPDSLGQQDRVDDFRVINSVEDDRTAQRRYLAGETFAELDPDSLLYFLLESRGRRGDQLAGRLVKQEDRRRVGLQHIADPLDQRFEQGLRI